MKKAPDRHSFLPNLFQRISVSRSKYGSGNCVQEEVVQLLRHGARSANLDLAGDAPAASSVLNYGLPSGTLGNSSRSDINAVIRHLKRALPIFEPRIDIRTLRISPVEYSPNQEFSEGALFDISAATVGLPEGFINFRVAFDFSNGAVHLARSPRL